MKFSAAAVEPRRYGAPRTDLGQISLLRLRRTAATTMTLSREQKNIGSSPTQPGFGQVQEYCSRETGGGVQYPGSRTLLVTYIVWERL